MGSASSQTCKLIALGLLVGCSQPKTVPISEAVSRTASASAQVAPIAREARYTFTLLPEMRELEAEVCFQGAPPARLAAPMDDAKAQLVQATAGARTLDTTHGTIALDGVMPDACVQYRVALTSLLDHPDPWDGSARYGDDVLLSPDWWLWKPEPRDGLRLRARFRGAQAAVPWPTNALAGYSHTIPDNTFVYKALAAFGTLDSERLSVGPATLEVAIVGDGFGERRAAVLAWLRRSAEAAAALLGRLPCERAMVLLIGDQARDHSFGFTVRGGGPSAAMLLPAAPSDSELAADWTAVHELLHFALPPLETEGAWLYEGMITYLTAVARAQAGIISEDRAWWELFDGFERGRKVGGGVTLREESRHMHDSRTYWRVYWSGAAIALQMDIALRQRGKTLPAITAALAASLSDDRRDWTAAKVITALDHHCAGDEPSRIASAHVDDTSFPNTAAIGRDLGVSLQGNDVSYDDAAPSAAIRQRIMRR
jgi:hypothetical protein